MVQLQYDYSQTCVTTEENWPERAREAYIRTSLFKDC